MHRVTLFLPTLTLLTTLCVFAWRWFRVKSFYSAEHWSAFCLRVIVCGNPRWLVSQPQSGYIAPYILQFACQDNKMDLAFVFIESIYTACVRLLRRKAARKHQRKIKMHLSRPFGSAKADCATLYLIAALFLWGLNWNARPRRFDCFALRHCSLRRRCQNVKTKNG